MSPIEESEDASKAATVLEPLSRHSSRMCCDVLLYENNGSDLLLAA